MKSLIRTLSLFLLLLAACTPAPSPQAALARANQEFDGRDVGEFFISYGSPAGVKPFHGGKIYRWLSLEPHGGAGEASAIMYPGGHFGTIGDSGNGEMVSGYCEISIRTDAQEKIVNLTLVYDSIGKYSGSRRAEIFSQPPN